MSHSAHNHPEDYRPKIVEYSRDEAYDDGLREERQDIAAHMWRCVPCDLTFDGAEMVEDGFERDSYGSIKCPNCGRTFNYDERTKK